jgi:hypothetical protein
MRDEAQVFMVVQFAICILQFSICNKIIVREKTLKTQHKDFMPIPYPSGYCRQNSYRAMAAAVAALWA